MTSHPANACFQVALRRPADMQGEDDWAFVILPKPESDKFARRGRTSVEGSINGHPFQAVLEPDGQLSHWLKIPRALLESSAAGPGSLVTLEVRPLANELEPQLPPDFRAALAGSPQARATWDTTTTIARIDWIHWIVSAKQEKTRLSRIASACDMLAAGKKRVCCFDPSGYYSKAFHAPDEAR
jgi:Bacteriocin-protection, YdeI or OmpD-Associated/Domain of unknown function (DUF1905)